MLGITFVCLVALGYYTDVGVYIKTNIIPKFAIWDMSSVVQTSYVLPKDALFRIDIDKEAKLAVSGVSTHSHNHMVFSISN